MKKAQKIMQPKIKRVHLSMFICFILVSGVLNFSVSAGSIESLPNQPVPPLCEKVYLGAQAGLLSCNNETQAGYAIWSGTSDDNIYLIDERGELRHQWISTHPNGTSYGIDLGKNGSILQILNDISANEATPRLDAGGGASHIEILDKNSNLMWEIEEYGDDLRIHHDAIFLPNGNVLAIGWEYFDTTTAISMGRKEQQITNAGLWPDVVIEYAPNAAGEGEIVWMWRASDHLVQDQEEMLPTYGSPAEYPEKININGVGPNNRADDADWMHCNSIDYEPVRKHILLSCRHTEELYIIDHDLTWEESNGSKGDLLYRWGNPLNYELGSVSDHHTILQHDAHFIPAGRPYAGSISYFSNEAIGASYIGIITPTMNGDNYSLNLTSGIYDPPQPTLEFRLPAGWGPRFQSGAMLMPNGQFLVSQALRGKMAQIGTDAKIDWEYNLPLNPGGQVSLRTSRPSPPIFFKAEWVDDNDSRLQALALPRLGVIENYDDLCPDEGDDILWDENGDGCVEDDDMDGVTNQFDWCADTDPDMPVDEDGCSVQTPDFIMGCMDPTALNYNPEADVDDGSCEYPPPEVKGCMDEEATNYNPSANVHDQSICEYPPPPDVEGCMDETALNFDADATLDDGSCEYPPPPPTEGCHDENATNYEPYTDLHNATLCEYPEIEPEPTEGCTDPLALNFDDLADVDDGSCTYPHEEQEGNDSVVDDDTTIHDTTEDVQLTCEERGDCPVEEQTEHPPSAQSMVVPTSVLVLLSIIAILLAFVLVIQLSRRTYHDDDY